MNIDLTNVLVVLTLVMGIAIVMFSIARDWRLVITFAVTYVCVMVASLFTLDLGILAGVYFGAAFLGYLPFLILDIQRLRQLNDMLSETK